jgi:hypothetical protein
MTGEVLDATLHIRSIVGVLEIPRGDIVSFSYREIDVRKSFKVGAQHAEGNGGLLDTGIDLRKGQSFKLTPSGTMDYEGNAFGPAGLPNWRWNSRNMGCLQWRIGTSGEWQILAAEHDGRAAASGRLQLCVHLTGGTMSGEFTVVFKTQSR